MSVIEKVSYLLLCTYINLTMSYLDIVYRRNSSDLLGKESESFVKIILSNCQRSTKTKFKN